MFPERTTEFLLRMANGNRVGDEARNKHQIRDSLKVSAEGITRQRQNLCVPHEIAIPESTGPRT